MHNLPGDAPIPVRTHRLPCHPGELHLLSPSRCSGELLLSSPRRATSVLFLSLLPSLSTPAVTAAIRGGATRGAQALLTHGGVRVPPLAPGNGDHGAAPPPHARAGQQECRSGSLPHTAAAAAHSQAMRWRDSRSNFHIANRSPERRRRNSPSAAAPSASICCKQRWRNQTAATSSFLTPSRTHSARSRRLSVDWSATAASSSGMPVAFSDFGAAASIRCEPLYASSPRQPPPTQQFPAAGADSYASDLVFFC